MKILLASKTGNAIPIIYQLYKAGNEIKAFIKNPACRRKLNGIVSKVNSITEGLAWEPDLIIFDSCGMGSFADKLKSEGRNVFGGSLLCDKLYHDPSFAAKKLKELGFNIKDSATTPVILAMRFKDGVPDSPSIVISTLDSYYPMGFGKRMDGMGAIAWYDSKLDAEAVKLYPYAEKHKFTGVLYFKFDASDMGLYDWYAYVEPDYSNVHFALQNWFDPKNVGQGIAATLRITISPYPFEDFRYNDFVFDDTKDRTVTGVMGNFMPNDVMFSSDWVTAGSDGIVGDLCAYGSTTDELYKQIADTFESIHVDEMAARVDFIDYFNSKIEALGELGFTIPKGKSKPPKKEEDTTLIKMYLEAVKNGDNRKIINITRNLREKGKSLSEIARMI